MYQYQLLLSGGSTQVLGVTSLELPASNGPLLVGAGGSVESYHRSPNRYQYYTLGFVTKIIL